MQFNTYLKLLLIVLVYSSNALSQVLLDNEFLVDGQTTPRSMEGKKPSTWIWKYIRQEDRQIHRMFMNMHAKKMHMLIISSNYAHFAHLHPTFSPDTGEFTLEINQPGTDPDNYFQERAIPFSGEYFIFTEVMPMPMGPDDNQMKMDRFHVTATNAPPLPDQNDKFPDGREKITTYWNRNAKQVSNQDDAFIKVIFSYQQFDYCDRWLPKFYFEFFTKSATGEFKRTETFDRWLNMGGHSILLSYDNNPLEDKIFYHLHAFLPMATHGQFVFPYHDHKKIFPEGDYKIWGQFKTAGNLYTIPISFRYTFPSTPLTCKDGRIIKNH